jgi:chromate transporter
MAAVAPSPPQGQALVEVALLFLKLGITSFGGPAAHVALMERECVRHRRWITRDRFLDLLGVSNLVPGPTSTELAMHIGRERAGWPGLVVAGLAFLVPAALLVGCLAALYVRAGHLGPARGILAAVQPVVLVVILDALVPLARSAVTSRSTLVIAAAAVAMAAAGVSELVALLVGGLLHLVTPRRWQAAALAGAAAVTLNAAGPAMPTAADVFAYFVQVGSLLFGSGYVLIPVLQSDLVEGRGWLTGQQLLDAIAAGQATPGPVFTTATFIGFLLGGPQVAAIATVGIFLPAFVFSALSSALFEQLRRSRAARRFLQGVNAAAVALIALVLVTFARETLTHPFSIVLAGIAGALIFGRRVNPGWALLGAAVAGALASPLVGG